MTIFDFHTHAFVDSLASRALSGLEQTSGISPSTDGTIAGLRDMMRSRDISAAMLLPVATKPSQQTTINNWAASVMGGGLYACGSVHPDAEDAVKEVERIAQLVKPDGVAAVILPSSILNKENGSFIAARESLLTHFYIRAIAQFGSKGGTMTNGTMCRISPLMPPRFSRPLNIRPKRSSEALWLPLKTSRGCGAMRISMTSPSRWNPKN